MEFIQTGLLKILPQTVAILLIAYLGCKVLDMLLGVLKSWKNANYKSRKMRDGIVRWIAEMVAVVFVIGIDLVLGLNFYLCGFTLSLFIYKEAGSICENLAECGVELPNIIKDKLEIFNSYKEDRE
jgi:toxin secretion/phage lysis holin|nr:MAG TPA: holin [Caudoviricetes sp.]